MPVPQPQRLARLIADLDSDQFVTRQQAMQELEKLGDLAESAVQTELKGKLPSLEMQRALERLLETITMPTPESLCWQRAIRAVEWMDTKEATALLQTLAKDGPGRPVRQDAAAALQRLTRRSN